MEKDIAVSIICNAYNHEKYIRDALEGFVSQKTNFGFEILVHDDASADKTADIIREYEEKYPDLIKPIYQSENQYSKKVKITTDIQVPRAKGRYLAICEGDDYWTDPLKLQKQFDLMEQHPEVDVCAHASETIDARTGQKTEYVRPMKKNGIIKVEKVIMGGGGFVATSSLFYRIEIGKNIPEYRKIISLDYVIQIQSSLRGGMLYIDEYMSVYRKMVSGSWTQRVGMDPQKRVLHDQRIIMMLEKLDEETQFKYTKTIKTKILKNRAGEVFQKVLRNEKLDKSDYKVIRKSNLTYKIKVFLYLKFPGVIEKIRK